MLVYCSRAFWEQYGQLARDAAPGAEPYHPDPSERSSPDDLASVEVAYFSSDVWRSSARRFFAALLQASNLRWLQTFSAGVDDPVFAMFRQRGVRLTTSSGSAAPPIAQTVIMYLLALGRDLPGWIDDQRARRWNPRAYTELEGQTVGVVGMGPIGTEVARLTCSLGMRTIGCTRAPTGSEPCETWPLGRLDELVELADWIVVALPLTDETRGLIGSDLMLRMRRGARLVNVGRGEVVDEQALVAALADGHLGGAALDVFTVEPLPGDSALWGMANVIITPHSSGTTDLTHHRSALQFVANLRRFVGDEPLQNEVGRR